MVIFFKEEQEGVFEMVLHEIVSVDKQLTSRTRSLQIPIFTGEKIRQFTELNEATEFG